MVIAAAMVSAAMVAKGSPFSTSVISAVGISAPVITASTVSTVGITATVVFTLETFPVEATAVEISCIPSLKEWPVVSIVIIIPIVPVPGRVVIIRIPRELAFIDYAIVGGVAVGVGTGFLFHGIGFLVDGSRLLIDYRRRCHIDTRPMERESDVSVDIYLCIGLAGD